MSSLRGKLLQQQRGRGGVDAEGEDDDEEGPTVVPEADAGPVGAAAGAATGGGQQQEQQQQQEGREPGGGEEEEEDDEEMDDLRAHFPMAFGGIKLTQREQAAAAQAALVAAPPARHGPPRLPPRATAASAGGGEEDEEGLVGPPRPQASCNDGDDGEDDPWHQGAADEGRPQRGKEVEDPYHLPVSHEASLQGFSKAVTCLDLDPAGARLLAGSHDYSLRIYDFGGMKSDMRAFRTLEPCEGHPVLALSWSPTGDAFLCVTGSPQPKGEFVRGDMYIRDMKNTKGHVSGCTGGRWHPLDKGSALTSSDDGTVRVWDMWELVQKTVIKPSLAKPGRVPVTGASWSTDGRLIGAGLMDGTLQLWDVRGKFGQSAAVGVVPQPKAQMVAKQASCAGIGATWSYVSGTGQLVRGAHDAGSEITCLAFSLDGHTLLTPDEKLIATAISADKSEEGGAGKPSGARQGGRAFAFFDRESLKLVRRLGMPGSAVALQVLYDPQRSQRGAMLAAARRPRPENPFDFQAGLALFLSFFPFPSAAAPQIYNPNALPLYREPASHLATCAYTGGGPGLAARAPSLLAPTFLHLDERSQPCVCAQFPTKKRKHVTDPTAASKARKPDLGAAGARAAVRRPASSVDLCCL
eukprot:scaffold8.g1654.t1